MSYLIPAQAIEDEQIIKKSRFVTYVQHTPSKQQALAFIANVKTQHPDARHHCWAYIAGHPTATTAIASSDDGEPQGTAGKPILNVLQHRNIGEITMVVVRYFGGIKLGAGGLVRAYSSSAHLAVEKLTTKMLVRTTELAISFGYALEPKIQHYLKTQNIRILKSQYGETIMLNLEVEEQQLEVTKLELIDVSAGKLSLLND